MRTYDLNEIKTLIEKGYYIYEIANELQLNKKHLFAKLKKHNIKINKIPKTTNNWYFVLELNKKEKTIKEISELTGICKGTINAYFSKNKIKQNNDNGILTGYSMFPMTSAKAYMLGVIFGDGSLGKENKKEVTIDMNDLDVLQAINNNVFDNKINIRNRVLKNGKIQYRLGIYNSKIWHELVENFNLGPNKTYNMVFPKLEDQFMPHFVRGLIDSDGSFYITKRLKRKDVLTFAFGSCSYDLVNDMLDLFVSNIRINNAAISKSKTKANNPFYSIKWRNKKDPLAIGQWIYKESNNLRGERKFSIWNKYYQEHYGEYTRSK